MKKTKTSRAAQCSGFVNYELLWGIGALAAMFILTDWISAPLGLRGLYRLIPFMCVYGALIAASSTLRAIDRRRFKRQKEVRHGKQ